jgi:hypothetical protein
VLQLLAVIREDNPFPRRVDAAAPSKIAWNIGIEEEPARYLPGQVQINVSEVRLRSHSSGGRIMGKETEHQGEHLRILEFLREKQRETDDLSEKQRIQSLLDAEADTQVMAELIKKLKTETAKRLVNRAILPFIVKHVLNLSAELKSIK